MLVNYLENSEESIIHYTEIYLLSIYLSSKIYECHKKLSKSGCELK